jgi:hypothetical protein
VTGNQHHSGDPERGEARGEPTEAAAEKVREQDNQN